MLEFSIVQPGGILRVTPSGALTVEDFTGLTRFADAYLNTHGTLGGLLIEAKAFPGWDSFAALSAHLRFVRDHQRRIERIALVTDSSIARLAELLAEPFVAADIRLFPFDQHDAALHWLRTDGRTAVRILVVLTSHDQLGTTGRKTGFWLEELAAPYYVFKDAGASVTLASPKGGQPPLDPASDAAAAASAATLRFKTDAVANAQLARTLPLSGIAVRDFDAVFYPGGHGPLWDLAEDPGSIALIEALIAAGGQYSKAPDWQAHVVTDGLLVTGQNPASSGPAAQALLHLLRKNAT